MFHIGFIYHIFITIPLLSFRCEFIPCALSLVHIFIILSLRIQACCLLTVSYEPTLTQHYTPYEPTLTQHYTPYEHTLTQHYTPMTRYLMLKCCVFPFSIGAAAVVFLDDRRTVNYERTLT